MRIVNDKLITSMRTPGKCRWCHKFVEMRCAHHLFARGHGGGRQIDIPANLIALGADPVRCCSCHASHHNQGDPSFEDLLDFSAADHDCLQSDIEDLVRLIQRMPKIGEMTREKFVKACERDIGFSARKLALEQLKSFEHLLRAES